MDVTKMSREKNQIKSRASVQRKNWQMNKFSFGNKIKKKEKKEKT